MRLHITIRNFAGRRRFRSTLSRHVVSSRLFRDPRSGLPLLAGMQVFRRLETLRVLLQPCLVVLANPIFGRLAGADPADLAAVPMPVVAASAHHEPEGAARPLALNQDQLHPACTPRPQTWTKAHELPMLEVRCSHSYPTIQVRLRQRVRWFGPDPRSSQCASRRVACPPPTESATSPHSVREAHQSTLDDPSGCPASARRVRPPSSQPWTGGSRYHWPRRP